LPERSGRHPAAHRHHDIGGANHLVGHRLRELLVLSWGEDIVPLVGARRRGRVHEACGALELELADSDLARIEAAAPAGAVA
jgi:hypothetical protein